MPIYSKIKFPWEKAEYFFWGNSMSPLIIKPVSESLSYFTVLDLLFKDEA